MIPTTRLPQVEVRSAAQLRAWLARHHARQDSVWLVTFKKHTGAAYVSRTDVLDELLCFGWIDGVRRKLDHERTSQLISPRRTQAWARSYRERVARLEAQGRMRAAGRRAVRRAKELGLWMANTEVDALMAPPDLLLALGADSYARAFFEHSAPSYRRNVLRWIAAAKRPATRAARIQATAARSACGEKVPQL